MFSLVSARWAPRVQAGLDMNSASPMLLVHDEADELAPITVESSGGFSSVRANVAVFAGRWQYEVILRTPGKHSSSAFLLILHAKIAMLRRCVLYPGLSVSVACLLRMQQY